jgi:anaerobic selenocysteine-containing dehydrogenase
MLQFKPGTDVALLNAMLNVIVERELYDRQYVQAHTEGFEALEGERGRPSRPRPWRRSAASSPT